MARTELTETNGGKSPKSVPVTDIHRLEACAKFTLAHYGEQMLILHESLTTLEKDMERVFFRAHRAHLVPLAAIKAIHGEQRARQFLELVGSAAQVPLARRKLKPLLNLRPDLRPHA